MTRAVDPQIRTQSVDGALIVAGHVTEHPQAGTARPAGTRLVTVRQLQHPRRSGRRSRFHGSHASHAYLVEAVVVAEALTIIAINTDPDAPIFTVAEFGIVGDLFSGLPEAMGALTGRAAKTGFRSLQGRG